MCYTSAYTYHMTHIQFYVIHITTLLDDLKSSKNYCPRMLFSGSNSSPEKSLQKNRSFFVSKIGPATSHGLGSTNSMNRLVHLGQYCSWRTCLINVFATSKSCNGHARREHVGRPNHLTSWAKRELVVFGLY